MLKDKVLVLLRILMGWVFFYSGGVKVLTFFTPTPDWTARMFLVGQDGPFATFFAGMAGSVAVDYLNAYGQLAIGLALILGLLVRFASFWGVVLMGMYYLAGYPPSNAFLVDTHVIYATVLVLLSATGAGRVFGLDAWAERSGFVHRHRWLLKLLG